MIARDYGYAVLDGTAVESDGVEAVLRRRERAGLVWGLPPLIGLGAGTAALLPLDGPARFLGIMSLVAFLVTLGLFLLWRRARRRERRVLETYAWQVWPCSTGSVRVASSEGERSQGRRWSSENRIVLLEPNGQSHCSFPPPWDGWDGPPVEAVRGEEIWFAGDTRFGGILASPGGMPFRYVTREKPGRRPATPEEDDLARRSGLSR